jgi:DNA-directed RNA polymerase subunit K/omega
MTPIEIIFAIREKLKEYVDDTRYTNRYLLKLVDLKRAVLIRQQYNQIQRSIDNQLEQLFVVATRALSTFIITYSSGKSLMNISQRRVILIN